MDVDALALCWIESAPFRSRKLVSRDPQTQAAIEALLSGGYRRLYEVAGPRTADAMIERAAFADTLNPRSLPALKRPGPRVPLPPLEPDAFLRWTWERLPKAERGPEPLTLDDIWFAIGSPEVGVGELRRLYVSIAAHVRRNLRLGLPPFGEIG